MTDRQFKRTRKRIRAIATQWIEMLGFKWWSVDLAYDRTGEKFPESDSEWEGVARVSSKWEYSQVHITFNMRAIRPMKDSEIAEHIRHELSHAMIKEMREWADFSGEDAEYEAAVRHEERVVDHMTKAFGWVYDYGFRAGKRSVEKSTP